MKFSVKTDHPFRLIGCLGLLALFLSPGRALAQTRINPAQQLRSWKTSQQGMLARLDTFRVTETVRHSADVGFGQRSMASRAIITGGKNIRPLQRNVLSFSGPGGDYSPNQIRRRRRQMDSVMRPEVLRLLDSFIFPGRLLGRFRPDGPPSLEERDGVEYWRFDAVNFDRPGSLLRPAPEPGPPSGERVRPGEGPPAGERQLQEERPLPFERLTAWFEADTFSLRATHAILPLPGRARISIRTNYDTIDGLGVSVRSVVEGSIPVRRRMRVFQVDIEQIIRHTDYELKFGN